MTIIELNKIKRSIIAKAWAREKVNVSKKVAKREWNDLEQEQLLLFNRIYEYAIQPLCINLYQSNDFYENIQFLNFIFEFVSAHTGTNKYLAWGLYDINTNKVYQGKKLSNVNVKSLHKEYKDKRKVYNGLCDEFGVIIGNNEKILSKKTNNFGVEKNK